MQANKIVIVICEGPSEESYLKELNRVLREENIPLVFYPKPSGSGHYSVIEKFYKKVRKDNPRSEIKIWVDKDIYERNDSGNHDKYISKPINIPDFDFNYFNYEDMLVLHLDYEQINKWEQICQQKNHFNSPLKSCDYEVLFKDNIFSDYEKGTFLLEKFDIETIKNAIKNNNDETIKFKSDMLTLVEEELNQLSTI